MPFHLLELGRTLAASVLVIPKICFLFIESVKGRRLDSETEE